MKKRHRWILMLLTLCSAALLTGSVAERRELAVEARVDSLQEDLAGEVFRFHVIANSDSDQDQALKYQVRDRVIAYMRRSLGEEDVSLEETKAWAGEHLGEIEEVARKALKEAGSSDRVKARVARVYFPDKRYGEIWFPQGYYEALQIRLGKAGGQNWWCVLYPNLCFTGSVCGVVTEEGRQDLEEALTAEEYQMVTAASDFKIKTFFFGDLLGEVP